MNGMVVDRVVMNSKYYDSDFSIRETSLIQAKNVLYNIRLLIVCAIMITATFYVFSNWSKQGIILYTIYKH